jgi:hypothetical protein
MRPHPSLENEMNVPKTNLPWMAAALLMASGPSLLAQDNTWNNFSNTTLTIKVVEDSRTKGKMEFTPGGILAKAGDTITWKPGQKMIVKYSGLPNYAHIRFQLVDSTGRWGEFVADNPAMGSATITHDPNRQSPKTRVPQDNDRQSLYNTRKSKGGLQISNTFTAWPYPSAFD